MMIKTHTYFSIKLGEFLQGNTHLTIMIKRIIPFYRAAFRNTVGSESEITILFCNDPSN